MSPSPWTDLEPQPGEFDADLATIDPRFLEARPGDPDAKLRIVVSIEGEAAQPTGNALAPWVAVAAGALGTVIFGVLPQAFHILQM